MAEEGKYGTIFSTKKTFHPGEPVFMFRATDPLTPTAVMLYHALCLMNGCSETFLAEIITHAKRIEAWQHANPTLVKSRPD